MTQQIATEIAIDASPARIWAILSDFARYPDWNPFILEVTGDVHVGAAVPYRFEFPRGIRLWAMAHVMRFDPGRELRWQAHFLSPGVFNGEHYFTIAPVSDTSAIFHHGEIFSGATLPAAWPLIRAYGPTIYQSLNVALKARAEGAVP